MRNLTYYVACSVDGYIAHLDGTFDGFLQSGDHLDALIQTFPETIPAHFRQVLGIKAENQQFDTVLMGRKTYEVGLNEGITNPYPHLRQYLFSRSLSTSPDSQVELISENAIAHIQHLKAENGQDIWLCGGATLAATLFAHHLIDTLILKLNPFLMGSGIPLLSGVINQTALTLTQSQTYGNGVVVLHYQT